MVTLWLGWSALIDFIIIPTTFRTLNDFFGAGTLGIALFSKLNNLEVVVASLLMSLLAWYQVQHKKVNLFLTTITVVAFAISLYYFAYLTPKISALTELWQEAQTQGTAGAGGVADVQQEHQFYHQLYVSLDTAKMILLLALLIYAAKKPESLA